MNSGCCDNIASLFEAAHALIGYRETLDAWLNGAETEDVVLGGVATPTLRKLIATIDERESQGAQAVVDEGVSAVMTVKNQLTALAATINGKVETLRNMAVTVDALPAGSSPAAAYDPERGLLSLGIPEGMKGDPGSAGPAGTVIAGYLDSGEPGRVIATYIDAGEPGMRGTL